MAPRAFFVLLNTNRRVALRINAIIVEAICISIGTERYEIFDRASHFAQLDMYCACICKSFDIPIDSFGETANLLSFSC